MTWMHPGCSDVVRVEMEVRVGGRFAILYRKPDGNEVEASGQYLEVVPDRKLVYTWTWRERPEQESRVTLWLEPDGDGTWLTLTHERLADDAQCEDHRRGWTEGIDSLARYVA